VSEIGQRLALTRRALGLTQFNMGRLMGAVSRGQAWQHFEAGRRQISIQHANALCRNLGLTLEWIYQGQLSSLPPDLAAKIQRLMLEDATRQSPPPTTRRLRR
jgi:transcriptional regulator with XRE-family HTH domain